MNHDIQSFLQPISSDHPCGDDLSFSHEFDLIQKARTEDDPLLDQGEWVTDRKIADWTYVEQQCAALLVTQSKDLRLCLWLCEAMVHRQGFVGLAQGLLITTSVITEYWQTMHPVIEDDDLDQRISLLQWFVILLQKLPKKVALTNNGFSFQDFEAAQVLKTQLDINPDLYEAGLPDHKTTVEQYQQAIMQTPVAIIQEHTQQLQAAIEQWDHFKQLLDNLLGLDAPAFAGVDQTLEVIQNHLQKNLKERGASFTEQVSESTTDVEALQVAPQNHGSSLSGFQPQQQSHIQNRQQAMQILEQISDYFSNNEPHSPVSYLLKKTIKWANMPLHEWLATVVKHDEPLNSLQDMLGVSSSHDHY